MKYLLLVASLILGLYSVQSFANPLERISNGKNSSNIYYFACNILVVNIANESVHLGGGTIITNRHVLTTASLIAGKGNSYRIDYRQVNSVTYEHIAAYIALIHNEFDPNTLQNDVAIIFLPITGKRFYVDPMLRMSVRSHVPTTSTRLNAAVVGHGHQSPTDMEMSRMPYYANVTTDGNTNSCNRTASTLFCAYGNAQGILCKGDAGSGIFTHTNGLGKAILMGLISRLPNTNCVFNGTSLFSQYTAVGLYEEWIQTITGINYT